MKSFPQTREPFPLFLWLPRNHSVPYSLTRTYHIYLLQWNNLQYWESLYSGSIQCRGESVSGKLDEYAESLEERIREEGVNLGPSDLVISFKKITSGLGRKNPVERVLFVDSRGKCVNYNTKYMKPNNIEEETILVMLRKEGEVTQSFVLKHNFL